jgi:hypothetical protein
MAEATSVFETGLNGDATIGTSSPFELPLVSWTFRRPVEIQRFRNSRTAGSTVKQPTYKDGMGTIRIDWDSANDPLVGSTPEIQEGMAIELNLIKDSTKTPRLGWAIPIAIVSQVSEQLTVDGKVVIDVSFEVSGTYAALTT